MWDGLIYSLRGLRTAFRRDASFRLEVMLGIPAVLVFAYALWPLAAYEILFVTLAVMFVLVAELFNTAIERVWERLHPQHHEIVGASKDIASAAVFTAMLFALFVAIIIGLSHANY